MNDRFNDNLNVDGINDNRSREYSSNEWGEFKGNAQPQEFHTTSSSKKTKKKKNNIVTKIISFTAATVATVSVGATVVPAQTNSQILEYYATDRSIGYFIMADEMKHDLVLVVENDNTYRVIDLIHGENMGDVVNLKPNMNYTLKIKQKNGLPTSAKEVSIRTQNITNESVWYGLEYTPANTFNGTFKFTPYFSDPQNRWVDFLVNIYDQAGYGIETAIEGSGIEHSIPLSEFMLGVSKGQFEIYGLTENGDQEFLYGMHVDFTKKHTEWLSFDYIFDVNNPTKLSFSTQYVDENAHFKNLTAKLLNSDYNEIASVPIAQSGANYQMDIPSGIVLDQPFYIEICFNTTVGENQEIVTVYSQTLNFTTQ